MRQELLGSCRTGRSRLQQSARAVPAPAARMAWPPNCSPRCPVNRPTHFEKGGVEKLASRHPRLPLLRCPAQSEVLVLFPITTVTLAGCLARSYSKGAPRSALTLVLSVWAGEIVLMSLPIFEYRVEYSLKADVFVAGCLVAATVMYFATRRPSRTPPETSWNRQRELAVVKVLAGLGLLGCTLLLVDAGAKGTQFSFSYLLDNLTFIRAEVFKDDSEVFAGPLALTGRFLAPCALLVILAAARLGRREGRWVVWLGVLSFALTAIISLFVYAGRAHLFYALLLVLVSVYVGGRRLKLSPRTLLVALGLVASVWYFSVTWFDKREGGVETESVLEETQRATLHPLVAPAVRSNQAVGAALLNLGYFSSPLPTLSFYVQQEPLPGPYWGRYSYPLPGAVAVKATDTPSGDWRALRKEIYAPLDAAGYFSNVWATWLRDLLVDFGYIGAVIYCGLFGAFVAWARNRYESTGSLHYHFLEVLSCFVLAFGAFTSLLWDSWIANAFFAAIGVMFAVRITFRDAWVRSAGASARRAPMSPR